MPIGDNAADALPVREVLNRLKEYIKRLPAIWVEGQLAEVKDRPGSSVIFATLRDLETDGSLSTSSVRAALKDDVQHLKDGDRVLMLLQPEIWPRRGELQMRVLAIKPVGIGELLVKLEALKQKLLAEGLFAPEAKQPIPFLPIKIGLVCGRASAALTDVLVNARNRWPTVEFEIREVAVQGVDAVKEVSAALIELEQDSKVDVIIVARGGGSLEDLLPFSDESLVRLVASLKTPIISAIGHEQDFPLL
jgi:exodeoxyribonuclease VII large subunit